jgi:iron complex transport system substrate-binding protein
MIEVRNIYEGARNMDFTKKAKKILSGIILFFSFVSILTGCTAGTKAAIEEPSRFFYRFTDSLGNSIQLIEKPQRVVSLVGSYAETWLLAGGTLSGVTSDVISERNLDLPKETKIIGTVKEPNLEEIINLSADFVLLSPDIESHVRISQTLENANIPFAFFKVEHFDDYLEMLKICTDITEKKEMYEKYGLKVKDQIEGITDRVAGKKNPTILLIRAFSSGAKAKDDENMACKILNDLGTVNIASKHRSLLEDLSIEEIIREDPDFIFVVTMGNAEEALKALKDGIEKNPVWSRLSAVKNNRYIVLPKELFHYKPNARWGESYEYMAKILYPEEFE